MKKLLVLIAFISINNILWGQLLPNDFRLGKNGLAKISSATPLSNSVSDIVIVGDTIWLGTSRGLSQSKDNGETWINYFGHTDFGEESIPALSYDSSNHTVWVATMHSEDKGEPIGTIRVGTGLRYSKDCGDTWNSVQQPIDDPADSSIQYGTNTLYILPTTVTEQNLTYDIGFTSDAVWVASWSSGLRKSTDLGQSWQRIVMAPDTMDSIAPEDTLNFRINPTQNNNHMYFSIAVIDDNVLYAGSAGGINKSADGGVSWQKFSHQNQEYGISGNWVIGLEENLADNSIWAVTRKANDLEEFYGISSSHDYGATWDTYLPGANGNNIGFRYYMNGNQYEKGDIIFCTDEGAYRSPNNGDTWILQPDIRDDETNLPIVSDSYLNAASKNITDQQAEVWLGTSGGLAKLTETSTMWEGAWKVYLASQKLEQENISFAFPNPFIPGTETTKIKYSAGINGGLVTIRILDFGMNLVRTIIQNAFRSGYGDNIEEWNGFDESGNRVANGVYFYRIDIDSRDPIYGKIMVMR